MVMKLCLRLSPKTFAVCAIALSAILCIYYASYVTDERQNVEPTAERRVADIVALPPIQELQKSPKIVQQRYNTLETCPPLSVAEADVNTVDVFKEFDFQPTWMKTKEYWDKFFEDRYERQKMDSERPPLKVIIVPHSHNDPGWLKTFEHYFNYQSRQIINHMVSKLQQYRNLTFIWSEVAFLNAWWEGAHPSKQRAMKALVKSGRLEITTGGWVMTDEANAHIYAMVDQLIEGHQWLAKNLDVKPKSGWSIDPFGHGSTQPYLLSQSGITGTVIQRIHYAWKQWLALKQYGDFKWVPNWSSSTKMLTHNQPFDIYSIKHSCGPHPYICLNFDFRKVQGEYSESIKAQTINSKNVKERSELLLEQYARTGSLFPHNVVLMPLGDDFRFNVVEEWDQQYTNYIKLIDYINANKNTYKAEVVFGTPKDYFVEIQKRFDQYPTLRGDFFVYSDIFSEGRPAYWSGYYTTRPFMKILDRELENSLRSAEILYTIALNNAKKNNLLPYIKVLDRDYEKLVQARRNLGLFQHHDAITGTSKSFVMHDYGTKLFESLRDTTSIQQNAVQSLIFVNATITRPDQNLILSDIERDSFEKLPKKTTIVIKPGHTRQVTLFNSLAQPQDYLVQLLVSTSQVKITDHGGHDIIYQINPVWETSETNLKMEISNTDYELVFVAKMPELSIVTYNITHQATADTEKLGTIYCSKCHTKNILPTTTGRNEKTEEPEFMQSIFKIKRTQPGDIQLENHKLKILFNGKTGFMKTVTRKHTQKITQCGIQFSAYKSAQFHSGAYLFMPDPNEREIEKDVLQQYKEQMSIIITSGAVSSELTVIYGPFLLHTIRIIHVEQSPLADGIYIENVVDFEAPPKNRETELIMRILSDVQNGDPPEFYSDSNGFQMQKRIKIDRIEIEGNYYPITTMAYIQDDVMRLSLLTNHAQGAASWQPGHLEVMLERRTLYDDSRGMGEGLVDNRKTVNKFWLLLEDVQNISVKKESHKRFETDNTSGDDVFEKGDIVRSFNLPTEPLIEPTKKVEFSRPSLYANQISNSLNYPLGIFILETESLDLEVTTLVRLISKQFPCDTHLLTLRTQPDIIYSQFPSPNALMVLHRQGYDCAISNHFTCRVASFQDNTNFMQVHVKEWKLTSLTGTETGKVSYLNLADAIIPPMGLQTFNITLF